MLFLFLFLPLVFSCNEKEETFEIDIEEGFPIRIEFGTIDSIPFAYSVNTGKPYHALFHHISVSNVSEDSVYIPLKLWWDQETKDDPNYSCGLGHHSLLYDNLYFDGLGPVCIWDFADSLYLLPPLHQFKTKLSPWSTVSMVTPDKNRTIADSLQLIFHLYEYGKFKKHRIPSERIEMMFRGNGSTYICTKGIITSK